MFWSVLIRIMLGSSMGHFQVAFSLSNWAQAQSLSYGNEFSLDCLQSSIFPLDCHDHMQTPKWMPSLIILWAQPGERMTIHWGDGCRGGLDAPQPTMLIHPTPAPLSPLVDCHCLPRLCLQYKQRRHLFWSSRVIVKISRKNRGL